MAGLYIMNKNNRIEILFFSLINVDIMAGTNLHHMQP
jgi:hypothetical protein